MLDEAVAALVLVLGTWVLTVLLVYVAVRNREVIMESARFWANQAREVEMPKAGRKPKKRH